MKKGRGDEKLSMGRHLLRLYPILILMLGFGWDSLAHADSCANRLLRELVDPVEIQTLYPEIMGRVQTADNESIPFVELGKYRYFRVDKNQYRHNGLRFRLANRGLFEVQSAYLDRKTLSDRLAIWNLEKNFYEFNSITEDFEVMVLANPKKVHNREVLNSIYPGGRYAPPPGKAHRSVSTAAAIAESSDASIYEKIAANVWVSYSPPSLKYPGIVVELPKKSAVVGRLFVGKEVEPEIRKQFYRILTGRMKIRGVKKVYIEVADLAHARLYENSLGFKFFKSIPSDKYGGENIVIMETSVDELLQAVNKE